MYKRQTLVFHQDPYTLTFLETRNESEGFESLCTFYPEMMACLDNLLVTWRFGQTWRHDSPSFCKFYDFQWFASITPIFNDQMRQKKTWQSIAIDSTEIWICQQIETQLFSHNNVYQQSDLKEGEFAELEGEFNASFKRDIESPGGKTNGDPLKGKYITIKLVLEAGKAGGEVPLKAATVFYIDSPLTNPVK